MKRLRVVLDTNVVVSAALRPRGLEGRVIELIAAHVLSLCISPDVLTEYREVFQRSKFSHLDAEHVSRLLTLLTSEATVVSPTNRLSVSPDEADNRFLECAESAEADFLITGNQRHFPEQWNQIQVVNAREFLRLISSLEKEIR